MTKQKINIFLLSLCVLYGCVAVNIPNDFVYNVSQEKTFDIVTWQKITNPDGVYKIYIEGDGHAFNAHGKPTNNPTPRGTLVREMAFGDKNENVVYVARPCQYIQNRNCQKKYWTDARFSKSVIDDEYQTIKKIVGPQPVILIGYSGGAQVAGLMATTKDINVKKIITIAGNLDHLSWTTYHHLPPLESSLNLRDYQAEFEKFNQIHYVGKNDKVIPLSVSRKFLKNKNMHITDAEHGSGWKNIYEMIRNER